MVVRMLGLALIGALAACQPRSNDGGTTPSGGFDEGPGVGNQGTDNQPGDQNEDRGEDQNPGAAGQPGARPGSQPSGGTESHPEYNR